MKWVCYGVPSSSQKFNPQLYTDCQVSSFWAERPKRTQSFSSSYHPMLIQIMDDISNSHVSLFIQKELVTLQMQFVAWKTKKKWSALKNGTQLCIAWRQRKKTESLQSCRLSQTIWLAQFHSLIRVSTCKASTKYIPLQVGNCHCPKTKLTFNSTRSISFNLMYIVLFYDV